MMKSLRVCLYLSSCPQWRWAHPEHTSALCPPSGFLPSDSTSSALLCDGSLMISCRQSTKVINHTGDTLTMWKAPDSARVCVCVCVLRGDAGVTVRVFGAGHHTAGFRVKLSIRTVWTILVWWRRQRVNGNLGMQNIAKFSTQFLAWFLLLRILSWSV